MRKKNTHLKVTASHVLFILLNTENAQLYIIIVAPHVLSDITYRISYNVLSMVAQVCQNRKMS